MHEVRIFNAEGKLKKVISAEELCARTDDECKVRGAKRGRRVDITCVMCRSVVKNVSPGRRTCKKKACQEGWGKQQHDIRKTLELSNYDPKV